MVDNNGEEQARLIKEEMENKLREKEAILNDQLAQKDYLEKMMSDLQNQIVQGG